MANSTEKAAPPAAEHQHQPPGDCPHAVASTLIQRHRDNRQRFDSADYEMAQRAAGPCAGCTCGKCAPTDGADLEQEPEPGSAELREQLRCLRLQRFDSADWAMQMQRAQEAPQTDSPPTEPVNVAQMIMDRHALKTCALVGPAPVQSDDQRADTVLIHAATDTRTAPHAGGLVNASLVIDADRILTGSVLVWRSRTDDRKVCTQLRHPPMDSGGTKGSVGETAVAGPFIMLDAVRKHALVILVAILFATYRLTRLEGERGRRGANIEQEFESVVGFLRQNLDTKYRVLRVAPASNAVNKLHAMVINGGFAIPHVEAEVFVDQQLALDQRKQRPRDHKSVPPVRIRVYDADAMTPIAETLKQRNLIATYEQG